jgi:hypothetical protein
VTGISAALNSSALPADTIGVEREKDRIARMKTLGEALDRARSAAEELCTQLGTAITVASERPAEPDQPPRPTWPSPATPASRR